MKVPMVLGLAPRPPQNIDWGGPCTMKWPEFSEFYAQLSSERLGSIYESAIRSATTNLASVSGSSPQEWVTEWTAKLPAIILDTSAVMSTHLLHEYHNWLKQYCEPMSSVKSEQQS